MTYVHSANFLLDEKALEEAAFCVKVMVSKSGELRNSKISELTWTTTSEVHNSTDNDEINKTNIILHSPQSDLRKKWKEEEKFEKPMNLSRSNPDSPISTSLGNWISYSEEDLADTTSKLRGAGVLVTGSKTEIRDWKPQFRD
ncbi:hypothetical protein ACTXT7_004978 [Hymenolepis weldensis]